MLRDVPKPSHEYELRNTESAAESSASFSVPQPDGFGTPEPRSIEAACRLAEQLASRINDELGAELERRDRVKVTAAFRRKLLPPQLALTCPQFPSGVKTECTTDSICRFAFI